MKEINVTSLSFSNSKHTNRTCDGEWRKEIMEKTMQTYTYVSKGNFALREKPRPVLMHERDAIVKVTLASICSSDLHIKHGSVPRAVPGITVGHEMVGIVEEVGDAVTHVKPGDRVTVNVETFCGDCFFCKNGYVNNCTDENGGWALGCRIDGGQAEYVRVPFADQGLNKIPENVTDRQALFVGDVLATGYWATRISEITEDDTVLIIGAGPTGICTLLCVMLKKPKRIMVEQMWFLKLQGQNLHFVWHGNVRDQMQLSPLLLCIMKHRHYHCRICMERISHLKQVELMGVIAKRH